MIDRIIKQTRGAGLAEFVSMISLLAIGTLGTISLFSDNLRGLFSASDNAMAGDEEVTPASRAGDLELRKNLSNFANQNSAGERQAIRKALQQALSNGLDNPGVHLASQHRPNFVPGQIRGMEGYRPVKTGTAALVVESGQGNLEIPVVFEGTSASSPAAVRQTVNVLGEVIKQVKDEMDREDSPTIVWKRDQYQQPSISEPFRRSWLLAIRQRDKLKKRLSTRDALHDLFPGLMGDNLEKDMELAAELRRVNHRIEQLEAANQAVVDDALQAEMLLARLEQARYYYQAVLHIYTRMERAHAVSTGEREDPGQPSEFLKFPDPVPYVSWIDGHRVDAIDKVGQLLPADPATLDVAARIPRYRVELDVKALEDSFPGSIFGKKLKQDLALFIAELWVGASLGYEPWPKIVLESSLHHNIRWSDVNWFGWRDLWNVLTWCPKKIFYALTFREPPEPPDPFEQLDAIIQNGATDASTL